MKCVKWLANNLSKPKAGAFVKKNPELDEKISKMVWDDWTYQRQISKDLAKIPEHIKKSMYYDLKINRWFRWRWMITTLQFKDWYKEIVPVMDEKWVIKTTEDWNILWSWSTTSKWEFIIDDPDKVFNTPWKFQSVNWIKNLWESLRNFNRTKDDLRWEIMIAPDWYPYVKWIALGTIPEVINWELKHYVLVWWKRVYIDVKFDWLNNEKFLSDLNIFNWSSIKKAPRWETASSLEEFQSLMEWYFNNMEWGTNRNKFWYKWLLSIFMWDTINKRSFFKQFYDDFSVITNDKEKAELYFWIKFWPKWTFFWPWWYRKFVERIVSLAGTSRWLRVSYFNLLPKEIREWIYVDRTWEYTVEIDWEYITPTREWFESATIKDQFRAVQQLQPEEFSSWWDMVSSWLKTYWYWRWVNSFDRVWKKVLQPWMYAIAMTFAEWTSLINLISLNTLMYLTDTAMKWKHIRVKWDPHTFMKRWSLLQEFDDWQIDYLDLTTEWLGMKLQKLTSWLWKTLNAWVFNISDQFMRWSYKWKRIAYFFQTYFPHLDSYDEITLELMAMPKEQRERILKMAQHYWDTAMMSESTNSMNLTDLNRLYVAENITLQPLFNMIWYTYDFMKWWAKKKREWSIKQIRNLWDESFSSSFEKQYRELATDPNVTSEQLKDWMLSKSLNNIDAIDFVSNVMMSFYLTRLAWRAENSHDNAEQWALEDMFDLFDVLSNFNWSLAAFRLLPSVQMFESFLEWFYLTYADDWISITWWLAEAAVSFAKTFTRWLWLFRWVAYSNWMIEYKKDHWQDLLNWETWRDYMLWIINMATAYSFYNKYEIEKSWFDKIVPISYTTTMWDLLWMTPQMIADYRKIDHDSKLARALEDIKFPFQEWFSTSWFWNWLKYRIPFKAEYERAQFTDYSWIEKAFLEVRWDPQYIAMEEQWVLPFDITTWAKVFIYNKVAQVLLEKNDTMDLNTLWIDKTYEKDWKKYFAWDQQVYQNIIDKVLLAWISKERLEEISSMIDEDTPYYRKQWARALAFLEANCPWSAIELIAYKMKQWSEEIIHNKYWQYVKFSTVPDEDRDNAKAQMVDKYWKYLWQADSMRVWPQAMLRVLKDRDDLMISKYISDPGEYEYWQIWLFVEDEEYRKTHEEIESRTLLNEFVLEVNTLKAIARWDISAYKMQNLFSSMFSPKQWELQEDSSIDPKHAMDVVKTMLYMSKRIESRWLPNNEAEVLKSWMYVSEPRYLATLLRPEVYNKLSDTDKQIVNEVVNLQFSTLDDLKDIEIENMEDEIMDDIKWENNYSKKWYTSNKNFSTRNSIRSKSSYSLNKLKNQLKSYSQFATIRGNFIRQNQQNGEPIWTYTQRQLENFKVKWKSWEELGLTKWSSWWWGSRRYWSWFEKKAGWGTTQWAWSARPKGAKTEDPDKTKDWSVWWAVKRMRRTSSKVKEWAMNSTRRRLSPKVKTRS